MTALIKALLLVVVAKIGNKTQLMTIASVAENH